MFDSICDGFDPAPEDRAVGQALARAVEANQDAVSLEQWVGLFGNLKSGCESDCQIRISEESELGFIRADEASELVYDLLRTIFRNVPRLSDLKSADLVLGCASLHDVLTLGSLWCDAAVKIHRLENKLRKLDVDPAEVSEDEDDSDDDESSRPFHDSGAALTAVIEDAQGGASRRLKAALLKAVRVDGDGVSLGQWVSLFGNLKLGVSRNHKPGEFEFREEREARHDLFSVIFRNVSRLSDLTNGDAALEDMSTTLHFGSLLCDAAVKIHKLKKKLRKLGVDPAEVSKDDSNDEADSGSVEDNSDESSSPFHDSGAEDHNGAGGHSGGGVSAGFGDDVASGGVGADDAASGGAGGDVSGPGKQKRRGGDVLG